MSDNVYRTIKVTGSSTEGIDDAIRKAVEATGTADGEAEWFDLSSVRGHITDGKVHHFQVTLEIGSQVTAK